VTTPTSATAQGTVHDYATFVTALTAGGATVQLGPEYPPNPIFDAPLHVVEVNGSTHLSVYEYPTATAAADEAACFHGGQKRCPGSQGGSVIDYAAPPHLYLAGRVLVLYVGTAPTMLDLLTSMLGPPVDEGHWD
jgi:hypothetical protein